MIPRIDLAAVGRGEAEAMEALRKGAEEVGFLTVHNTDISREEILEVISAYRAFFTLPDAVKSKVDMARTGANRGWGAPQSEQVDPDANPDYKQVFDCGFTLPEGDAMADLPVYAPNLWPEEMPQFQEVIERYYSHALTVAKQILRGIARAIGEDETYFDDKFDKPMALLRGNFYPQRPDWAGEKDFGIAAHTDYGCVTLLATDGVPGLEVLDANDEWVPVVAEPGTFVINFGEMLQMWTGGRVKATLHRVKGSKDERISVPLFFNPNYDTNVAPMGSDEVILAGDHLTKRFEETYIHMKDKG